MSKKDDWRKELGLDGESNKPSKKQKKIKIKDIANAGIYPSQLKLWGLVIIVIFLGYILFQNFGSAYARCVKKGKNETNFKVEVIKAFCSVRYK